MSAELKPVSIIPPREDFAPNNLPAAGPVTQLPAQSETAALIHMIDRMARDPSIDMGRLQRFMEMRKEIRAEEAESDFNAAMAVVQSKMRSVAADANNPQTKSRYASYHALDKAIRPIYSAEGLALSFDTDESPKPEHIRVVCYVTRGRYTRKYKYDMPADGKGAKGGDVMTKTHAAGAAFTYGQRYLLKAIFNIAVGDDDDSQVATGTITDEQAETIKKLTEKFDSDTMAGLLKYVGADNIASITAAQYDRAMYAIGMKKGQSQGQKK